MAPGDYRNLTEGVSELKIDVRPATGGGNYAPKRPITCFLLWAGAVKRPRPKDIAKPLDFNREFEGSLVMKSRKPC